MQERDDKISLNLFTILQVIFLALKMAGVITWSWWAVFMPTYIDLGIFFIVIIILSIIDGE